MQKYLIASDLDHTLLLNNHEISEYTKAVLSKLINMGHFILPCTARSAYGLPKFIKELNIQYVAPSNGALIYDCINSKELLENKLDTSIIKEIVEKLKDIDVLFSIEVNNIQYSDKKIKEVYEKTRPIDMIEKLLHGRELVDDVISLLDKYDKVNKLHLSFSDDKRSTVFELLNGSNEYTLTSSHPNNYEVTAVGVSKGEAIKKFMKEFNMNDYQVIAFGDNYNDISMIELANHGVAMINGVLEIKEKADAITNFSNDEDGVAKYLSNYFKLQ